MDQIKALLTSALEQVETADRLALEDKGFDPDARNAIWTAVGQIDAAIRLLEMVQKQTGKS